jgi:protein involved in temperature-dependent protein secretion
MEAMMEAVAGGDYAKAYDLLQKLPEARTPIGAACSVFLLAIAERFDDADRIAQTANAPAMGLIARGERQRVARWRDRTAAQSLSASTPMPTTPFYAAIATAFAHNDTALADRAKGDLAQRARPIAGSLTMANGTPRPFSNLTDTDDAIGQMLETFCNNGLLYFPFESLRRVEMLPKTNFMDLIMPKAKLTERSGNVAMVYVPMLYACSATDPDQMVRNGRTSSFNYLGSARRSKGQRDFMADGAMIGLQNIAAIDFI